jgi:hypothetical protein
MGNLFGALGVAIITLVLGGFVVQDDNLVSRIVSTQQTAQVKDAVENDTTTDETKAAEGDATNEGSQVGVTTEDGKDTTVTDGATTDETKAAEGDTTDTDAKGANNEDKTTDSTTTEDNKDTTTTDTGTDGTKTDEEKAAEGDTTTDGTTTEDGKETTGPGDTQQATQPIQLTTLGYSSGVDKSTMSVTFVQNVSGESYVQYDLIDSTFEFDNPVSVFYGNRPSGQYFTTVDNMVCDSTFAVRAVVKVDGKEVFSDPQYLGTASCNTDGGTADGDGKDEPQVPLDIAIVDKTYDPANDAVYLTYEYATAGDVYFEYGTKYQAAPDMTAVIVNQAPGKHTTEISNLACGKTYMIRAVLKNSVDGTASFSNLHTIQTKSCDTGSDNNGDVVDTTQKVAIVDWGEINDSLITVSFQQYIAGDHYVEYGYITDDGQKQILKTNVETGKPADFYTIALNGLQCGTLYNISVVVSDKEGVTYSEPKSVSTFSCDGSAPDDGVDKPDDGVVTDPGDKDAINLIEWKTVDNGDGSWVAAIAFEQNVPGESVIRYVQNGDKNTAKELPVVLRDSQVQTVEINDLACESVYEFQVAVNASDKNTSVVDDKYSDEGDLYKTEKIIGDDGFAQAVTLSASELEKLIDSGQTSSNVVSTSPSVRYYSSANVMTGYTSEVQKFETGSCKRDSRRTSSIVRRGYIKQGDAVKTETTTNTVNSDGTITAATLTRTEATSQVQSRAQKVRQEYAQEVKALTDKLNTVMNSAADDTDAREVERVLKNEISELVVKMAVLSEVVKNTVTNESAGGGSSGGSSESDSTPAARVEDADEPLLEQRIVSRGTRGNSVGELQGFLNTQGARLEVDNIFGPLTEEAVRSFQEKHGLVADGIVGPQTLALFESLIQN